MKVKIKKDRILGRYNSGHADTIRELAETDKLFEVNVNKIYMDKVILMMTDGVPTLSFYVYNNDLELVIDDVRNGLLRCEVCENTFYLRCSCGSHSGHLIDPYSIKRAFFIDREIAQLLKNKLAYFDPGND